ncbi:MAG: NUDIX hydrolase, partial [Patescibacteria group bacterium]
YGVVLRKLGVGILAVNDKQQIFVQQDFKYPIQKFLLNIPVGGVDEGEDVLIAAQRELKEEGGLDAKEWKKLGSFYTSPGMSDEFATLYLATGITAGPTAHEGTETLVDQKWMDIQELYRLLDAGELTAPYFIVALALARQYLQPKA